jgi:hypothetical protein
MILVKKNTAGTEKNGNPEDSCRNRQPRATICTNSSSSSPDHKVSNILAIFRMTVFGERSLESSHLSKSGEKPTKDTCV